MKRIVKPIIFLLIVIFLGANAKSVENCVCSKLVNKYNIGNCIDTVPDDIGCYLRVTSKCPDLEKSEIYPGRYWSKLACKLKTKKLVKPIKNI